MFVCKSARMTDGDVGKEYDGPGLPLQGIESSQSVQFFHKRQYLEVLRFPDIRKFPEDRHQQSLTFIDVRHKTFVIC